MESPIGGQPAPAALRLGNLVIDLDAQTVTAAGADVRLTATEWRLLVYLARNAGRILPCDMIFERVWGEPEHYASASHTLAVALWRLRCRLPGLPLEVRRGIGYGLRP